MRWLTGEAEDALGPGVEGDADDEDDDQDEDDHADHRAGPEGLCNTQRRRRFTFWLWTTLRGLLARQLTITAQNGLSVRGYID